MAAQLFLMSSSRVGRRRLSGLPATPYASFWGDCRTIYFVPFAIADYDRYTSDVAAAFASFDVRVVGLHTVDARAAVEAAEVLFHRRRQQLPPLERLHQLELIEPIQRRVAAGELRYIGSSAGTNMACPSLRTTNDMPIVQPPSFEALGLVPFQINPHYVDPDPASTHMGETPRGRGCASSWKRTTCPWSGLREGAWLRAMVLADAQTAWPARACSAAAPSPASSPGADLSWLLEATPRFDVLT